LVTITNVVTVVVTNYVTVTVTNAPIVAKVSEQPGAKPAEKAGAKPAPPAPPKNPWSGSMAVGVTITRGNSSTTLATFSGQGDRKTKEDEVLLGLDAAYGEASGVKNTEQIHGFGQYNRKATDGFYWGARLDGLNDQIAEINYRLTLAPLGGYHIIDRTNTSLSVELGPGYVYQDQNDNGTNRTQSYATLRGAERFEHKFDAKARIWQTFEIDPQVDDFNNYYVNAEVGAEAALTKRTSLRLVLDDTYYNIPATDRKKNDLKLVGSVAYKF
jgi:putative salt-induced outer membrane protein YdiY